MYSSKRDEGLEGHVLHAAGAADDAEAVRFRLERQGQRMIDDMRQHEQLQRAEAALNGTSLALSAVAPSASPAVVAPAQAAAAHTAPPAAAVLTAQPMPDPTPDKVDDDAPAVPVSKWAKRRARQRANRAAAAGDCACGHLIAAEHSSTVNPAKTVPAELSSKLTLTSPACPVLAAKAGKQLLSNGDKPTAAVTVLTDGGSIPAAAAKKKSAVPLAAAQVRAVSTVMSASSSAEDRLRAVLVTAKACTTRLALTDLGRQGTVADTPAPPAFEGDIAADIQAASSATIMLGDEHPYNASPVQLLPLDAFAQTPASESMASTQLQHEPVQQQQRPAAKEPSLVRSAARKATDTSNAAKGDDAQLAETVRSAKSALLFTTRRVSTSSSVLVPPVQ